MIVALLAAGLVTWRLAMVLPEMWVAVPGWVVPALASVVAVFWLWGQEPWWHK